MALFGVSITKRCVFRDSTQEFSNVYHYSYTGLNPSASLAESVIDAIVVIEKTIHSTGVSFVYARAWSAGGTISQNQMIFQKALSGTGSLTDGTTTDRERAVLIQWPAGFDSRGHPVKLKKWFHVCSSTIGGTAIASSVLANTAAIQSSARTAIESSVSGLNPLVVNAQSMELVAESGRDAEGGGVCHKYFEHHQLGDQWRG